MKYVVDGDDGSEVIIEGHEQAVSVTVTGITATGEVVQVDTAFTAQQVVDIQFALNRARDNVKERRT